MIFANYEIHRDYSNDGILQYLSLTTEIRYENTSEWFNVFEMHLEGYEHEYEDDYQNLDDLLVSIPGYDLLTIICASLAVVVVLMKKLKSVKIKR